VYGEEARVLRPDGIAAIRNWIVAAPIREYDPIFIPTTAPEPSWSQRAVAVNAMTRRSSTTPTTQLSSEEPYKHR